MRIGRYLKFFFEILKFIVCYPMASIWAIWDRSQDMATAKLEQARLMKERFDKNQSKMIFFLVRPRDEVSGGIMSICSIATESKKLEHVHGSKVAVASYPKNAGRVLKFSKFHFDDVIFQFEELLSYFEKLEKIQIHIPEFMVSLVARDLSRGKLSLKHIPEVKFNILNQNVQLMPHPRAIARLKKFGSVTCTTAHSRYCTLEESEKYGGVPYHHLTAFYSNKFYFKGYREKENLLVVSPDSHPIKEKILKCIRNEFPAMEIKIIQNMSYEEFKQWVSRAKWSLTFGEGMDAYYHEPLLSGALPFAVYNAVFFPNEAYGRLSSNFSSYEEMLNGIVDRMKELDNEHDFNELRAKQVALFDLEYSYEAYVDRIRNFYEGRFALPNNSNMTE